MLRFAAIRRRLSCPKHSVSTSALPTALWPSPTPTTPWSLPALVPARPFGRSYISSKMKLRRAASLRVVAGPDAIQRYLNARMPGRLIQSTKSYLASRLFSQTQIFNRNFLTGRIDRHPAALSEQIRRISVRRSRQQACRRPPGSFQRNEKSDDDDFAVGRLRKAFANAGFDEVHFLPSRSPPPTNIASVSTMTSLS